MFNSEAEMNAIRGRSSHIRFVCASKGKISKQNIFTHANRKKKKKKKHYPNPELIKVSIRVIKMEDIMICA